MIAQSPPSHPRVDLRIGNRTQAAVPLMLTGNEVSLVVAEGPSSCDDAVLVLDWAGGSVTELRVSLSEVPGSAGVTRGQVREVRGEWRPFLEFLGHSAA